MPALPTIANVYRVTLHFSKGTLKARCVLHFQKVASNAASVFADLDAHVTTNMWGAMDTATSVVQVDVLPLDGSSSTVSFAPAGTKWAGPNTVGDCVIAPAALVKFQTGLRGPAKRGRIFLPFSQESAIQNGTIDSGHIGGMQTAWTNFLAAMVAVPDFPVVASYAKSSAQLITNAVVELQMGTQRRRQNVLRKP